MISVSIVNVTSYTGLELLRLLAQHPQFVVTSVTARSAVGKRLDEVFPQLRALEHLLTVPEQQLIQHSYSVRYQRRQIWPLSACPMRRRLSQC